MEPTYFKTSREMLWHILWKMQAFTKRDDLLSKSKKELVDFQVEIYDLIVEQLNNSEE